LDAITAVNLKKEYNGTLALDNLSFEIPEGSFILLLGPNGAGKTTLLRCILGLVRFEGELKVYGLDVKSHGKTIRRLIGYVPQTTNLYNDVPVTEIVDFFSDLKNVTVTLDVLEKFGLMEKSEALVGELSGGMRQKLSLLLALMGNPSILLLDEPFSNLDARGRLELLDILKTLKRQGKTILLSTHTVSGVLTLADNVFVLNRGKIIHVIKPHELHSSMGLTYRIHLRTKNNKETIENLGLNIERTSSEWLTIKSEDIYATLAFLFKHKINIQGMIIEEPSADEIVVRLTDDSINIH